MQILSPMFPEPLSKSFVVRMVQVLVDAFAQVLALPDILDFMRIKHIPTSC